MDLSTKISRVSNVPPEEVINHEVGCRNDWNYFTVTTILEIMKNILEKSPDVVAEQSQRYFDIS